MYFHVDPPSPKNTRGPTRMADVWNMPAGKKIAITLNKRNQPITKTAKKLADFLGTLARNGDLMPINSLDWRLVKKERKEELLEIIKVIMKLECDFH